MLEDSAELHIPDLPDFSVPALHTAHVAPGDADLVLVDSGVFLQQQPVDILANVLTLHDLLEPPPEPPRPFRIRVGEHEVAGDAIGAFSVRNLLFKFLFSGVSCN